MQAMNRQYTTAYRERLVDEHTAPAMPEVRHRDGYEGRVPTTHEGISDARKRAAMWLAFASRSSS